MWAFATKIVGKSQEFSGKGYLQICLEKGKNHSKGDVHVQPPPPMHQLSNMRKNAGTIIDIKKERTTKTERDTETGRDKETDRATLQREIQR